MYLSASRQFDTVIVWEQRNSNGVHKIRTFDTPYDCYIKVDDWRRIRDTLREAAEEGRAEPALKSFVAQTRDWIDTRNVHLSMFGDELYRIEFPAGKQWRKFLESVPNDIRLWETDIPPELKVLSREYYKATDPTIRTSFYDIEIDYDPAVPFEGAMNPQFPLNSIAFYHVWKDEYVVFAVPPPTWKNTTDPYSILDPDIFDDVASKHTITLFNTEAELLVAMVEEIQQCDLMSGWNSALFDDPYIAQRVEMVLGDEWFRMLSFPRGKAPYYRELEIMFRKQKQVQFDGRITIDYMDLFKKFTVEDRDSWSLESVSADHLGDKFKKLDYEGTLNELYTGNYAKANLSGVGDDKLVQSRFRLQQVQQELDRRGLTVPADAPYTIYFDPDFDNLHLLDELELCALHEATHQEVVKYSFSKFVRYNIRDTEVLAGLDKKYKYIDLANWMMHYSTCQMKNVLGTVRKAEMAVANFCWHELGRRIPDTVMLSEQGQAQGAYVLVPQGGIQTDLFLIDINSLYPSCIKSLNISPEKYIGQFVDTERDRQQILQKTDKYLVFTTHLNEKVTKTACEWYDWLVEHKYAMSGHGTVYNQDSPGIVPTILESWHLRRKEAQGKSAKAKQRTEEILNGAKARVGRQESSTKLVVKGIKLTDEEYAEYMELSAVVDYNDSLSYAFKILQNSYYGAQLNQNFKFYAKVAGESTTGTGRRVLEHQIRKTCELLDGNYWVDPIVDEEDPRALRGEVASPSLIYGDTDSGIFTLKNILVGDETQAEKIKIADTIAGLVNKSFPKFMMEQFLVQPEFSTKIKTGRELFSPAAFFVSKKRYAMHVTDKEGIPKNDLKIMGLDAKKTTTPRNVRKFLRQCVMDLLTGKPAAELDAYIMEYRDNVIDNVPIMDVGLPKGVKKVEMYTKEFYSDHRTRLPGHVAASIFYNEMRDANGDTLSLQIVSGMKIKVFNFEYDLEHRGRKFNSIALPTDTEILPLWFVRDFVPLIDRVKHSKKLVDNMLHNMFDSIPRHVPTRHVEALMSEFDWG